VQESLWFDEWARRLEEAASRYAERVDRENLAPRELLDELEGLGAFRAVDEGPLRVLQAVRAISRWSPGTAHIVLVHSSSVLAMGENPGGIVAFSMTEPGGGTDILANLQTRAEGAGDGYRITGEKIFTSNAPYASHFLVLASTSEGPALFLAPRSDRIHVEPLDLLGLRGSGASRVVYRGAPARLAGSPGRGVKEALRGINLGRLGYAAIALGIADAALSIIASAGQKVVFGRRLVEYQGIQWRIAEIAMERAALEALVEKTAGTLDPVAAASAKNLGASLAQKAAWAASQILGGRGLARWSRTERMMRDSRVLDIGEGAREVLLDFIASRTLRSLQA